MNQDYRGRVERHRATGGDEKYVNVKAKAKARHESSHEKALGNVLKGKNIEGKKEKAPFGGLFGPKGSKGAKFTEELEKHKGERMKFR